MKPLKIDNWSSYVLQRLTSLFEEGTKCDASLQLTDGRTFRAHSLILFACSPYFDNSYQRLKDGTSLYHLPAEADEESLTAILRFMYTGKLDIRDETYDRIHELAKLLQINILVHFLGSRKRISTGSPQAAIASPASPALDQARFQVSPPKVLQSKVRHPANTMKPFIPLFGRGSGFKASQFRTSSSLKMEGCDGGGLFSDIREAEEVDDPPLPMEEVEVTPPKPSPPPPPPVVPIDYTPENPDPGSRSDVIRIPSLRKRKGEMNAEQIAKVMKRDSGDQSSGEEEEETPCRPEEMHTPEPESTKSILKKSSGSTAKKVRFSETPSPNLSHVDREKIVHEVAKKYPTLGSIVKPSYPSSKVKIVEKTMSADELRRIQKSADKNKVAYLVLQSVPQSPKMSSSRIDSQSDVSGASLNPHSMKVFGTDWICHTCQSKNEMRMYQNLPALRAHYLNYHKSKITAVCERCGTYAPRKLSTVTAPLVKFDTKLPEATTHVKCITCRFVVVAEPINEGERENGVTHECGTCGARFNTRGALDGHVKAQLCSSEKGHKETKFPCPHCTLMFNRSFYLKAHMRSKHPKELRQESPEKISPPESMTPSSESEALDKVASGIATSLAVDDPDADLSQVNEMRGKPQQIVRGPPKKRHDHLMASSVAHCHQTSLGDGGPLLGHNVEVSDQHKFSESHSAHEDLKNVDSSGEAPTQQVNEQEHEHNQHPVLEHLQAVAIPEQTLVQFSTESTSAELGHTQLSESGQQSVASESEILTAISDAGAALESLSGEMTFVTSSQSGSFVMAEPRTVFTGEPNAIVSGLSNASGVPAIVVSGIPATVSSGIPITAVSGDLETVVSSIQTTAMSDQGPVVTFVTTSPTETLRSLVHPIMGMGDLSSSVLIVTEDGHVVPSMEHGEVVQTDDMGHAEYVIEYVQLPEQGGLEPTVEEQLAKLHGEEQH
ncbi:unnamed protein product [Darwinula stevensoni]|uniref:Uncharacterized protein n=1 Tax=Darwinula stevensoni TaxID=69355 RepID=A0A7R9A4B2_9CRUS|nr:unnamed protein product [Darwinula stevensoni]CAG0893271.1 unnamed protein product [Darwinula stevensoni]